MFEREAILGNLTFQFARFLVHDLQAEDWRAQPAGLDPPLWHLGHLAAENDGALVAHLGLSRATPVEWDAWFLMGSRFGPGIDYPAPSVLLAGFKASHERLITTLQGLDPAVAERPNPSEYLRNILPTLGDQLAHLATTHLAMHTGQLAAWRRAMGLPSAEQMQAQRRAAGG